MELYTTGHDLSLRFTPLSKGVFLLHVSSSTVQLRWDKFVPVRSVSLTLTNLEND